MKGYLFLEDKTYFQGVKFGADTFVSGEVVFSTGMVGYPAALTDPSFAGQILVLTYPLIGNYGVPLIRRDGSPLKNFESTKIQVKGLIVDNYVNEHSHWQAVRSLDEWLKAENIPALYGIDTRFLTIKLREKGVVLGFLNGKKTSAKFEDPNKENLVAQVSIEKPRILGKGKKKILLIDCGVKDGIITELLKRDVQLFHVPWNFDPFDNSINGSFDGVIVSNGPGDPKTVKETIKTIKKLLQKKAPILGICLGNQLISLAIGADTYKMKYGHRSHNQPVKMKDTRKCYLTTQNHGFAVDSKSLPKDWEVWFENLNDGTNEGIRHKNLPFMAVQFHPEGRPGPYDTFWIFDEFIKSLKH